MDAILTIASALTPYASPQLHPVAVYLASMSEGSRRVVLGSLTTIAAIATNGRLDANAMPWHLLRYQHTQAIRSALSEQGSPATANRHLSALRGVLKECWRLGYMEAEDYHRAVDLKPVKGQALKAAEKGRHLTYGEVAALVAACDDGTKAGARDAAMLALGEGCGLRRAEIVGLDVADIDMAEKWVTVRKGKGAKARRVPMEASVAEAVGDWLTVRGAAPGALFWQIRRGDHMQAGVRLTAQSVAVTMAARAKAAGVQGFTPHDMRRTFAGNLLDAGVSLSTVQMLMGHSSANTTAGYDRRGSRAMVEAVSKTHFHYRKQK